MNREAANAVGVTGGGERKDSDRGVVALHARRRVEFRDTDAAGIVHFSAFFFWMESAEHELMRQVGLHVFERHADGSEYSWPRVSVSCDYRATARFGDELDIAVRVASLGRTSVTYQFTFEHAGRSVAEGRVVAVRCLMRPGEKLQPVAIPADIVARLSGAPNPGTGPSASSPS